MHKQNGRPRRNPGDEVKEKTYRARPRIYEKAAYQTQRTLRIEKYQNEIKPAREQQLIQPLPTLDILPSRLSLQKFLFISY